MRIDGVLIGPTRCVDGRLYRHDPQHDDPHLETDIGPCPECDGKGCGDDALEFETDLEAELYAALEIARTYMAVCLGAPRYDGPNPYPIINAALARAIAERSQP